MLELLLIRHGETTWNAERRIQGQQHNDLSALGVLQAQRLGARLQGETFDHIYCSDLKRTVQTAEWVFPGRELHFDERLREIKRGVLETRRVAELEGEARALFDRMQANLPDVRPPGGENYRDLSVRAVSWFKGLPPAGKSAAVTHGGIIRALLHYVIGGEWARVWCFKVSNTSLTRLRITHGHIQLECVNDTAHLEARPDLHAR